MPPAIGPEQSMTPDEGWVYLEHPASEVTPLSDWFDAGVAKVCVYVDSEDELLDIAEQGHVVRDRRCERLQFVEDSFNVQSVDDENVRWSCAL